MPPMIPAPGAFLAGIAIFLIVVWDAFESIILPRRVTRKFRLTRAFYKTTWRTSKFLVNLLPSRKARENLLGFYGPISLLVLIGVWADAVWGGIGSEHDRRPAWFVDRLLPQRDYVFYTGTWRRGAAIRSCAGTGGGGGGVWIRISCGDHRLFALYLRVFLETRGGDFAAGF